MDHHVLNELAAREACLDRVMQQNLGAAIGRLPGLQYSGPTLRDMVATLVGLKGLRDEYLLLGFIVPKSMTSEIETLTSKAKSRYREDLEANLATAKKKADELKSKEKQREEAEAEVARLTAELEGK